VPLPNALSDVSPWKDAASNYSSARKQHLRLAKKGDPFSQYRSSYMHLQGEGVEPDYPIAFAWAVLAAESGDPRLALLPESAINAARN
jgi:TPR repeat protein